jgi:hypothetical protein
MILEKLMDLNDFVRYSETFQNKKEICEEIDSLLSENEQLALLFSRAYRNDVSRGTPYVKFADVLTYYKNLPHQNEALIALELILTFLFPNRLPEPKPKKLSVPPYYSQRDNYRDPHRTCNGSATAMAVKWLNPSAITGDDEFVRAVFQIGDVTVHSVVDAACRKFGVNAQFDTRMTYESLKSDLMAGKPVVLSILHRGPLTNPSGGHMVLAYEWVEGQGVRVHDPYGNLYTNYQDTNGKSLLYKFTDLSRRWLGAYSPNVGWGRRFK